MRNTLTSEKMKRIGIFYGSTTGTTAEVAAEIAKKLGVADDDVHDVASTAPHALGDYDVILAGTSTWGNGELQEDWYDFVDGLGALDLRGKTVAVFGCGDQTMSETFCNAVGELRERFARTGATMTGDFPATEYNFNHSRAADGALMCGLVLDQVNHPEYTDGRIDRWLKQVSEAIAG